MSTDPIVIVGAARTPMGGFLGDFRDVAAPALGARAISAAVERAGVPPESVDEILMGCVLPAGQGQAPARQASLGAGLPLSAGCTTINKMCGSGMKAAMVAHDLLRSGSAEVVGRRRHGEHEQRPLSARPGAHRLSHGPRPDARPHVPRRARGRLRQGPPDGDFRRGLRAKLSVHPRGAGRLRPRLARAREPGDQGRRLRLGNRPGDGEVRQDGGGGRDRRTAAESAARTRSRR